MRSLLHHDRHKKLNIQCVTPRLGSKFKLISLRSLAGHRKAPVEAKNVDNHSLEKSSLPRSRTPAVAESRKEGWLGVWRNGSPGKTSEDSEYPTALPTSAGTMLHANHRSVQRRWTTTTLCHRPYARNLSIYLYRPSSTMQSPYPKA
ncbi:hypothetical protein PCASD_24431 [Puccinia coronata f. sp. avenae]|uniref:Uncharacterized protein n=1 Tax=Puccinia coronata f. sp. avenae TaxID=200324 RepID=A0A2N5RYB7_9BASI|nr:hypothetical protein PCASD_24431 [Puccinia coronata f. sp. avenae]